MLHLLERSIVATFMDELLGMLIFTANIVRGVVHCVSTADARVSLVVSGSGCISCVRWGCLACLLLSYEVASSCLVQHISFIHSAIISCDTMLRSSSDLLSI